MPASIYHHRVKRVPWLTLLVLLSLGVPSERVEFRTTPGSPRLGGCKEIERHRSCKLDPRQDYLTLWWPMPRRTDALVLVDFKPQDLEAEEAKAAGEVLAGFRMDVPIPPGSSSLVLVDRTIGAVTDWKLEPWQASAVYDGSTRCDEEAEPSSEAWKACKRWHINHLSRFGDDPQALSKLAAERYLQDDFIEAAELHARAGRLFLGRGRLSRGIDALHSAALSTLARSDIDAERFVVAEQLLAEAAQALQREGESGTQYARGEAYHAFVESTTAQYRGQHVHARAWGARAVRLMRQINDFRRLADTFPEALDAALSIGEAPELDDFDDLIEDEERRWRAAPTAAARMSIECYPLAHLYVSRAWLGLRLGEAGDPGELDTADEFSRRALEVEDSCPGELEHAKTHLVRAAVLLARGAEAEAAAELGWVYPHLDDLTPDNRTRHDLIEAVLQARGLDRDAGLDRLEALMSADDTRPEDRWLAAIALGVEAGPQRLEPARRAFRVADELLAEGVAPRLQGGSLEDARRNGGLRVGHLLWHGLVEEAACAARQAHIRKTAAHRRVAALSQASTLTFMGARAVRARQVRAETSREQLSEAGAERTTWEIVEDLKRSDEELQWATEGGAVPSCAALRQPADGETLIVVQPLADQRTAVFEITRAGVTVSDTRPDEARPVSRATAPSSGRERVFVVAGETDALAAEILAADPHAALAVERSGEQPGYIRGLAQLWYQEGDGLDSSSREVPRLERDLIARGWTVQRVTDVETMRATLAMPQGPELLYIGTHGTPGGLLTTDGGVIRQVDILLARSVPRLVIVAACHSEELGATLTHAGSELVIAGRGDLVEDAAPALIEGLLPEGNVDLDIDAVVAHAALRTDRWLRLRNF